MVTKFIIVLLGIGATVFIGTIIFLIIKGDKPKCSYCKLGMEKIIKEPYLYLLPLYTDDILEDSNIFFIKNMIPIREESQIPSGQRACYLEVYQCKQCREKKVLISDFLKVRDYTIQKENYIYKYEGFEVLIQMNQSINSISRLKEDSSLEDSFVKLINR